MAGPQVIPFVFPGLPGVRCAFQTRVGGVDAGLCAEGNISLLAEGAPGAALANRRALMTRLGVASWQEARQVHGAEMLFDPAPSGCETGGVEEADGLAVSRPGAALVIKTADCQPVLLAHEGGGHVAALHVGWRGNEQRFPQLGVAAFCRRYGLRPEELFAVRGPSLGPGASEFVNFAREWDSSFSDWFDPQTQRVDLWRLTRDQLLEAGLRPERLFSLDLCTFSLPELFFSYRRGREPGRQGSFIWIEE